MMFAAVLSTSVAAEMIREPVARLEGLDKITARVSKFDAPVDEPMQFGTLTIRVRDCEKNPPEESPESAAFLEIDELRPGDNTVRRVFGGWMFASSPALSALEHPVYDVILLDCKAARGSSQTAAGSAAARRATPSAGSIWSPTPSIMRMGLPVRSTFGGCRNGAMARISTAPASAAGRIIRIAAAILAPLE